MRRENKDPIETDFDDLSSLLDEDNDFNFDDEPCAMFDAICSMIMMPKPFGWVWDIEKIERFLKERGYKIIERKTENDNSIKIAVKLDESCIPDLKYSNLREIFDNECQDIILSWLLKIGK